MSSDVPNRSSTWESTANISSACFFSHGPVDRKSKQPSHFTVRYGIRWPIAFDDLIVIICYYIQLWFDLLKMQMFHGKQFVITRGIQSDPDQHPRMIKRAFWQRWVVGPKAQVAQQKSICLNRLPMNWMGWCIFFPTRLKAWLLISMAMEREMRIFMMFHDVHGDYVSGSTGSATQELPTTSCCDPLEAASIGGWIPGRVPLATGGYQKKREIWGTVPPGFGASSWFPLWNMTILRGIPYGIYTLFSDAPSLISPHFQSSLGGWCPC